VKEGVEEGEESAVGLGGTKKKKLEKVLRRPLESVRGSTPPSSGARVYGDALQEKAGKSGRTSYRKIQEREEGIGHSQKGNY